MTTNGTTAFAERTPLRRRNRRLAITLAIVFVALVLMCVAYIAWFGGSNKPPMRPYHSLESANHRPTFA